MIDLVKLKAALDKRDNPGRTHYAECYLASDHRDCAIAHLIEALENAHDALNKLRQCRLGTGVKVMDLVVEMAAESNPDALAAENAVIKALR